MQLARAGSALRTFAFVYFSASVMVVFSERVFWFWSPDLLTHLEGALWYSLPMATVIWAIAWYRVSSAWAVVLVAPLAAYVTEGVLTPVLYTGGPFVPFFPIWFTAWHGLGSMFLLWFCVRRWTCAGRWRPIAALGAGLGLFWGGWASTLRLPENREDPELLAHSDELVVLDPGQFALHATMVALLLVVSHAALDRLWPTRFSVGASSTRVLGWTLTGMAAVWTFAVPWALPMFLMYGYLQVRALRRHRAVSSAPNVIEQLAGSTRVRHLTGLLLMAPTAGLSYLALWLADPSDLALRVIYYGVIAVQTLIGAIVAVRAWRRRGRPNGARGGSEMVVDRRRIRTIDA